MLRVAVFSGGKHVPSARFRVAQYAAHLQQLGIELHQFPAAFGNYPPALKLARPAWLTATIAQRVSDVLRSHQFDVTMLQRELVSTLVTLERFTARPRVLDIDDAVWLLRSGRFIDRIAATCDAVICGNEFLAEHFRRVNQMVWVLPTPVDIDRYAPARTAETANAGPVIGWTGTSGGYRYLYQIEAALARVLAFRPEARLRVVADRPPSFTQIPAERVEFVPWRPETEVAAIQGMDIGLMPLADSDWERGKCSYKMLLYMACGIPVVVSPVGMNREVLNLGQAGCAVQSSEEWRRALLDLLDDPGRASAMGREGRRVVLTHFSLQRLAPQLGRYLRQAAS